MSLGADTIHGEDRMKTELPEEGNAAGSLGLRHASSDATPHHHWVVDDQTTRAEALHPVNHPVYDFYCGQRALRLTDCCDEEGLAENDKGHNGSGAAHVRPEATRNSGNENNGERKEDEESMRLREQNDPKRRREYSYLALHLTLLPPSMVEVGAPQMLNDQLYSKKISSDVGIELLRRHWDVLLHVLLPVEKRADDLPNGAEADLQQPATEPAGGEALTPSSSSEEPLDEGADAAVLCSGWSRYQLETLQTPDLMDRMHYSYIIFLRFFGWRLHDDTRGVLDRHSAFQQRYALLRMGVDADADGLKPNVDSSRPQDGTNGGNAGAASCGMGSACAGNERKEVRGSHATKKERTYPSFNFYGALTHILESLLSLRLFRYGVGLVEFIIEEMQCDRLEFLHDMTADVLLPRLERCASVDESHCSRLRKKLRSLVESDSE